MNTGDIAKLDKEIARVEGELAGLHQRRVALLQADLQAAQQQATAHSAGKSVAPSNRGGRKPASASPAPVKAKSTTKKKTKTKSKGTRKRMSSQEVESRTLNTVKAAGATGLSQKEISDKSGVNYQTTAKKLKELLEEGKIGKRGKLKNTRYFLKG